MHGQKASEAMITKTNENGATSENACKLIPAGPDHLSKVMKCLEANRIEQPKWKISQSSYKAGKPRHHRYLSTTTQTAPASVHRAADPAAEYLASLILSALWTLIIANWIFPSMLKRRRIHRRNIGQRPEVVLNIIEVILKIFNVLCFWPFKLFVGRCWYCGGWGHYQYRCPKKRECWNCEETGHNASRCPYPWRA